MRIVVLYALAGGGHLSAAKALKAQLDGPDCEVIPVDSTRPFGRFIDFFCCDLYRFSAKYVPRAFGLCYRLTDRRAGSSRFMRLLAAPLARRLLPVIEREKPDVVVCAYPFSCQLAAILKARGLLRAKVVHMLTDYGAHAAWISGEADEYWASCEEAAQELVRRGVPKEKIVVRGIPVNPRFSERPDRGAVRRELGLPRIARLCFLWRAQFGVRSVLRVFRMLDALPDDFEAVVITGKNEKLFRRFEALRGGFPSSPAPDSLHGSRARLHARLRSARHKAGRPDVLRGAGRRDSHGPVRSDPGAGGGQCPLSDGARERGASVAPEASRSLRELGVKP